jgi:hypothetical protein
VLNFNAPSAASGTGIPPSISTSTEKLAEPNTFWEGNRKEPTKSLPNIFAASSATSSVFLPTTVQLLVPVHLTFSKHSEEKGSAIPVTASLESKPVATFAFRKTSEGKPAPSLVELQVFRSYLEVHCTAETLRDHKFIVLACRDR